jgi:hypothetical protein
MTTDDFKMKFGDDPSRESLTILVEKADDPTDQLFGMHTCVCVRVCVCMCL